MNLQIRKAERKQAKLRLAIAGPSGAGKTMGALKLARGIGKKVCLIDTERGSGDLYADLYEYDIISLEAPFKPERYVEAIHMAEDAGYDVIIVDSLSHAWSDDGGLLDQADKLQGKTDRFRVWANLTPQHRKLVTALLTSPTHIIATMRSKQEYAMEKDESTGKTSVKKHGLAPVQREGMEYEFTVFFDVDQQHQAAATKDRTNMFNNEVFTIDESIGQRIHTWLTSGKADPRMQKREVIAMLHALKAPLPAAEDMREWLSVELPKRVGLDWSEENLTSIIDNLRDLVDAGEGWEPKKDEKNKENPSPAQPEEPPVPEVDPVTT